MRLILFFIMLLSSAAVGADARREKDAFPASIGDDGIQRVEIIGGNYFFKPDYIMVKKGFPVEFIVKKSGGLVPHNIVMKESGAGIVFEEDLGLEQKVIRFTPEKTGRFRFYCDKKLLFFKSHREKGMEGTIEVID